MNVASNTDKIDGVLIAIEQREDSDDDLYSLLNAERIKMKHGKKIILLKSPWINFKDRNVKFNNNKTVNKTGCKNLFTGIQINPNGQLIACCGLACEYTPFLKLGKFNAENVDMLYYSQFNDLLKIWLYTEGPVSILNKINNDNLNELRHHCDYCLDLLGKRKNVEKLLNIDEKITKEILFKYNIKIRSDHENYH